MITVFKAIHFDMMPKYLRGLFQMRNTTQLTGIKQTCCSILKHNSSWITFLYICISNCVEGAHSGPEIRIMPLYEFKSKVRQFSWAKMSL